MDCFFFHIRVILNSRTKKLLDFIGTSHKKCLEFTKVLYKYRV